MVREELSGGLRNAIERGSSLEQAKHSFISAGYSREEVEEASNFVYSGSVIAQAEEKPMPKSATAIQPAVPSTQKSEKPAIEEAAKPKRNFKIILLIVILMVLIIIFILTLLFKDKIIEWFA